MLFKIFVFIYIYWRPTRFIYQITCLSFNSNTTSVLFLLSMVLSVLLVFTTSNYPLCILKNTTQHVSDTTIHKQTQHNMCRTQLCTKKHNTACVGHNYAQTTQHNMCRTQLYTKNTTQHVSDTTIHQQTQHNMCRTQLCTKTTTQHMSDTAIHQQTPIM